MTAVWLAVIDLAGTTVDDHGLVDRAFRQAVTQVAGHLPDGFETQLRAGRGQPKLAILRSLFDGDRDAAEQAHHVFESLLLDGIAEGIITPLPGAAAALSNLRQLGMRICLATGFSARVRDRLLAALRWRPLADLVICADDTTRGRPYPDPVLTALMRLSIDAVSHVVVVGDTTNDLLAGSRAGAAFVIGVLSGAHRHEQLERVPHTHIVNSIRDVPTLLAQAQTAIPSRAPDRSPSQGTMAPQVEGDEPRLL